MCALQVVRIYSLYEAEGASLLHSIALHRHELTSRGERYVMHFYLHRASSVKRVLGEWRRHKLSHFPACTSEALHP